MVDRFFHRRRSSTASPTTPRNTGATRKPPSCAAIWQQSTGTHKVVSLQNGKSRAENRPPRWAGHASSPFGSKKVNFLGSSLLPAPSATPVPAVTRNTPRPSHQSAGFASAFEVVKRSKTQATLQATVDSGLVLQRRKSPLNATTYAGGDHQVHEPTRPARPRLACARTWRSTSACRLRSCGPGSCATASGSRGMQGRTVRAAPGMSRRARRLVLLVGKGETRPLAALGTREGRRRLSRRHSGWPNTLALDLATNRSGVAIPSGKCRQIKHKFGWVKNNEFCDKINQQSKDARLGVFSSPRIPFAAKAAKSVNA